MVHALPKNEYTAIIYLLRKNLSSKLRLFPDLLQSIAHVFVPQGISRIKCLFLLKAPPS